MATAPFQLWIDLAPISTAIRSGSTVTVTTVSPHGLVTGCYVQMDGATGAVGTSLNGVYSVTVTSGSAFTYTAAGSAGTATTTSAILSNDLLNPPINYAAASRQSAVYVPPETISVSASGDGVEANSSFRAFQDDTPSDGPWFRLIPDESRVRFVKANTGTAPAADKSDLVFVGMVANITAGMSPSGQGNVADITLNDPTSILDRLVVAGNLTRAKVIAASGAVRATNVTTITTTVPHGFVAGNTVEIVGVTGGGGTTFNGKRAIVAAPTTTTFTYSNAGADATGATSPAITAAALSGKSLNKVQLTVANHGLVTGMPVKVAGITISGNAEFEALLNGTFGNQAMRVAGANTIEVTLAKDLTSTTGTPNVASATLTAFPQVLPVFGPRDQNLIRAIAGELETTMVARMLSIVDQAKTSDVAVQRIINTSDATKIVGSTTQYNKSEVPLAPATLRSILDSAIEVYSGQDGFNRRYFVNKAGQLVYELVSSTQAPTYATAPYKIITTGAGTPNTTTAAATVAPYSLTLNVDHNTTKSVVFTLASTNRPPQVTRRQYTDLSLAARPGAPVLDVQMDYPNAVTDTSFQMDRAALSTMKEAYQPIVSGQFTLRGAGTAAHNDLGFSAGYAQTGASTFALVNSWQPGQWVDVTCAELGLSGLYRIEEVDVSFEPGSYTQIINVLFGRRPALPFVPLSFGPRKRPVQSPTGAPAVGKPKEKD